MKVLEEVCHNLNTELPHCKSHNDVEQLLIQARDMLVESKAPLGQKQRMWEDVKGNLSTLIRRPEVVNDAHAVIDRILKRIA